ncbi:hypothetical protein [Tuwongella immobilis]|uniref:Uncharacterized protein n=1 Tax=Tuwongella immobilis TaxID=692036 RepID=A0A6C2YRW7_9BACT|nr:hypothetical protein [Tuwongella immobilis]VIP03622.1 unnamed protein product [Tuwongella immobilis]VTS04612.1 unnamed protein product [Tuwongella immobilis]
MRSKRLKLIAMVLVVTISAGIIWILTRQNPIGPDTFNQIKIGMPIEEVRATIILPPGEYEKISIPVKIYEEEVKTKIEGSKFSDYEIAQVHRWLFMWHQTTIYYDSDYRVVHIYRSKFEPVKWNLKTWLAIFINKF